MLKFQNLQVFHRFKCVKKFSVRKYTIDTENVTPLKLSYTTYENTQTSGASAAPFLVLHGLFGSKSNWNSLCKVYQQKTNPPRKVIGVDARNHGDSPHSNEHSYAHMVADLKLLLDELGITKVALSGHSMGGRAVALFALKYPELVERVIILDISIVMTSPSLSSMPGLFRVMERVQLPKDVPMSQGRSLVDQQLAERIDDKSLRSFLLTNLVRNNDGSFKWRINIPSLIINFNNVARFPDIQNYIYKGPALFLGGEDSDYLPESYHFCCNPIMRHRPSLLPIPMITKFVKGFYSHDPVSSVSLPKLIDLSYASYEKTDTTIPKAPPLIILHGLLSCKSNFNFLSKRYLEKTVPNRKIFAVDMRNHGDSVHLPQNNYDGLIMDLKRFLDEMELKNISLLGHDVGGRVAMLFALKYPELLDRLIISDVSPITTSQQFIRLAKLLQVLSKVSFPANTPLAEAKAFIGIQLAPLVRQPRLLSLILLNLVQKPDGRYSWKFNLKALLKNYEELAAFPEVHNLSYSGPSLFLGGAKSDYLQRSDFPKIQKLFPNAELKYIQGAGHWLHSEKPNEFLEVTLEFLNRKVSEN